MEFVHKPVLFAETIAALDVRPGRTYIDGTVGGGGHALAILQGLGGQGRLLAIDQDPDAIAAAGERLKDFSNLSLARGNFSQMAELAQAQGIGAADGILLDIGVSSHQLDDGARGFSYHQDAPLDMRMSQQGPTAAELVNHLAPAELAGILLRYGEEKSARRIAQGICRAREQAPIATTGRARGGAPGRGPPGPQDLPGPAHCGERGAGQARRGPGGWLRPAEPWGAAGGYQLPLPGGQNRQAADGPVVPGLHLPQGFPGVRVREQAQGQAAL